jgi:Putative lumazine-binding
MRKLVPLLPFFVGACNQLGSSSDAHSKSASAALDCNRDAMAAAPDGEREAVAEAVQLYFQGHSTGDGNYYRRAFHPDARLFWVKDGAVSQKSSADFIAGAPGKPADDEAKRARRIAAIDVAGNAAMAKVELAYPSVRFVDYLSLLKVEGRWTIVNKIFHREDIAPSAMR